MCLLSDAHLSCCSVSLGLCRAAVSLSALRLLREFADREEVQLLQQLHASLTSRLLQGQTVFKGIAPLFIAALDASAALDGLLLLQNLSVAATEAATSPAAAAAGAATAAVSPTGGSAAVAAVSKRLLRLHPVDRLEVVQHVATWLQLLPPAARAMQPFDQILALVKSVRQTSKP